MPQRNRNELGETTVNKTGRKGLPQQEKSKMFTAFGTQGRQVRRTKLLVRLNSLKGNTEEEWCKTGKKQTVEGRVMAFEWGSCT